MRADQRLIPAVAATCFTLVDRIAGEGGYSDPTAFRKLFPKINGLPLAADRQKFSIAV